MKEIVTSARVLIKMASVYEYHKIMLCYLVLHTLKINTLKKTTF